jgi:hypothetical protein
MIAHKLRLGRGFLGILGVCGLLPLAGCGGLRLVPVAGKVTLDGKPMKGGSVSFNPDSSKGNDARVMCVGRIDSEGRYELTTTGVKGSETGKGAPLGWYRVTLITTLPGQPVIPVADRYLDFDKTPLSVEVIADPAPDRYDLKLTK